MKVDLPPEGPGAQKPALRLFFAGSPGIAVPALEALAELELREPARYELAGVLTNPDSPRGRSGRPEPTGAGAAAARISETRLAHGKPPLALIKAPKLDAGIRSAIAALRPDLLVSFAYGRIFGPKFLGLFPRGGINIHPSLLPKYRGAAPIPAAILHRESETGISIQRLAAEMDSGDILAQKRIPLDGRETTETLRQKAAEEAVPLLLETLSALREGTLTGRPQNHREASYCSLLSKEEGRIDWTQGAADIDARIRAFTPWPLCWTNQGENQGGQTLFILEAFPGGAGPGGGGGSPEPGKVLGVDKQRGILVQTGEGVLFVTRLQYQAKKALEWRAFLNGARGFLDSRLG
jgi:methionyl-tRNA formyltransferase